ncbi:hypothetical protein N7495_003503 [Penicillium taxi]|uniref:uncharacterized protein n=1 Tax=Penicillium taxi TaxID=168475 RepID=UPI002544DBF4|nr:uncharacterized protein N7495_003503 [Penicillium taxi]KAJ5898759.1 hypothetical protein N7495_003503 [Penicillium taxi]
MVGHQTAIKSVKYETPGEHCERIRFIGSSVTSEKTRGCPMAGNEIVDDDGHEQITFKVTTPTFFTRFFHYNSPLAAIRSELLDDEKTRTVWCSHPEKFASLFSGTQKEEYLESPDWRWKVIKSLRTAPLATNFPRKVRYEPCKGLSATDILVLQLLPKDKIDVYRRDLLQVFLSYWLGSISWPVNTDFELLGLSGDGMVTVYEAFFKTVLVILMLFVYDETMRQSAAVWYLPLGLFALGGLNIWAFLLDSPELQWFMIVDGGPWTALHKYYYAPYTKLFVWSLYDIWQKLHSHTVFAPEYLLNSHPHEDHYEELMDLLKSSLPDEFQIHETSPMYFNSFILPYQQPTPKAGSVQETRDYLAGTNKQTVAFVGDKPPVIPEPGFHMHATMELFTLARIDRSRLSITDGYQCPLDFGSYAFIKTKTKTTEGPHVSASACHDKNKNTALYFTPEAGLRLLNSPNFSLKLNYGAGAYSGTVRYEGKGLGIAIADIKTPPLTLQHKNKYFHIRGFTITKAMHDAGKTRRLTCRLSTTTCLATITTTPRSLRNPTGG